MRVSDILKVNNVWVFRIREEGEYGDEETRVKKPCSERGIQLRSVLVDTFGFVQYVKHIKKLEHSRVFWELPKRGDVYHKECWKGFMTNIWN